MTKFISLTTTAFLLGTLNVAMADGNSSGSMDMENPSSKIQGTQGSNATKQDQMTGDARGSTTGKRLIKSDAQRHDAEQGGLDGVK